MSENGESIVVGAQGSFFVGGHTVVIPHATGEDHGLLGGSGLVIVDQMYVNYQIPSVQTHRFPVIMVHGGCHTGKTFETTPDGREGWATYFLRQGIAVYVVDMATRGRSSFDATQFNLVRRGLAAPSALPNIATLTKEQAWVACRIGPEFGIPFPNTQFPVEAAEQYFSQIVSFLFPDRPTGSAGTSEPDPVYAEGLISLLDEIGPSILLTHSQSGRVGWQTAIARPDLVRGIANIEGVCLAPEKDIATLARIPVRVIFGDFTDLPPSDGVFGPGVSLARSFIDSLVAFGGEASLDLLPEAGIVGNSHMMMMDKNNLVIADRIIDWLNAVEIRESREKGVEYLPCPSTSASWTDR